MNPRGSSAYRGQVNVVCWAVKPLAASAATVWRAQAWLPASATSALPSNGLWVGAWIVTVHDGWTSASVNVPSSSCTPRAGDDDVQWIWRTNDVGPAIACAGSAANAARVAIDVSRRRLATTQSRTLVRTSTSYPPAGTDRRLGTTSTPDVKRW